MDTRVPASSTRWQTSSIYLYCQIETIQLDPILRSILKIIWKRTLSARRTHILFLKTSQAESKLRSPSYPLPHLRNHMEADTVRRVAPAGIRVLFISAARLKLYSLILSCEASWKSYGSGHCPLQLKASLTKEEQYTRKGGIKQVLGTVPKIRIQRGGDLIPNHAYISDIDCRFRVPI
ncbi:MAG: hypothetical protein V3T32_03955 [Thermodesulfobacteriota bacterium]